MDESVSVQLTIWSVLSAIKDICREILKALLIWLLDEQDHAHVHDQSSNKLIEGNQNVRTGV